MGQKIWKLLEQYEGNWVAVNKLDEVIAHAPTLPEVMEAVGEQTPRITFLYAAGA